MTTTKSSPLSDKTPHSGSGGGGTTVSSTLTHRGSGGDGNGRSANDTYKVEEELLDQTNEFLMKHLLH